MNASTKNVKINNSKKKLGASKIDNKNFNFDFF